MRFKQYLFSEESKNILQILMEWADPILTEASWPEQYALDALSDPRFQSWLKGIGVEGQIGKPREGGMGRAYPIGNNYILKFTTDRHEADAAAVLTGQQSNNAATIYGVKLVSSFTNKVTDQKKNIYAIVMDRVNTGVGKKFRIAGGAVYAYMDQHNGPIQDGAYEEIVTKYLPPKYRNDPNVLRAIQSVLQSVQNLYQNTGVLTQDTHGGNMAFKGKSPAYFDFGRSKINLDHPNVLGKRIGRL